MIHDGHNIYKLYNYVIYIFSHFLKLFLTSKDLHVRSPRTTILHALSTKTMTNSIDIKSHYSYIYSLRTKYDIIAVSFFSMSFLGTLEFITPHFYSRFLLPTI